MGSSYTSIKSYLFAIKHSCNVVGHSVAAFDEPRLQLILRAVKKQTHVKPRASRLPITVWILHRFHQFLDLAEGSDAMLWAALCVGVYGLLRAGEFTVKGTSTSTLRRGDVQWLKTHVVIHLRESKSDIFRSGVDIKIFANNLLSCPYQALKTAWTRSPVTSPSAPLFQYPTGRPLDYHFLQRALKVLTKRIGFDDARYSSHSLRIGGATTLAVLGFPAHVIRTLGRWRSLSYQLYTRVDDATFAKASQAMGSCSNFSHSVFGGLSLEQASNLSLDNVHTVFRSS